jgi:phage head maturation protease
MEKKYCNLQVKEFHSDERTLSGYASTFGFPADSHGDVIKRGAFVDCIKKIQSEGIPLLDSHKQDSVIKARLADTPRVEEIRQKLKQGHINKMSIGFFIEAQSFTEQDGKEYRVIEKADLIEVSVVPIPANSRAEILAVKEQKIDSSEECACTDCGCEKNQENGVRANEATENAVSLETPNTVSEKELEALKKGQEILAEAKEGALTEEKAAEVKSLFEEAETHRLEAEKLNEKSKLSEEAELLEKNLETAVNRVPVASEQNEEKNMEKELFVKAHAKYLRYGKSELNVEERKALASNSDPDGGIFVHGELQNRLIEILDDVLQLRALATVVPVMKVLHYQSYQFLMLSVSKHLHHTKKLSYLRFLKNY